MFRPTKVIDPNTPKPKMEETNQNIQVFVRCRPINTHEKKSSLELIAEKRVIRFSPQNKHYAFDNVFDQKAKQLDVYRSVVEPLVDEVIEGYNCTVFAYGQTGTGKTYTMVGDRSDKEVSWEEDPTSGIIPRAIDQLIDSLANQETEYTIRVSFLELYNEEAYDLLSPLTDNTKLRIYNDTERKGSVIISGLVEMIVKTKAEIFEILEKGSLKRQTAPTLMNACSSRSHSIFSITVHIKEIMADGEEVVKMGKLNLVDLAGSENIGRSGAVEERAREASNINKSLLTLGRVITSLVEKSSHIPYRDSKLTRLLQDSLGGKTKTSIIATISPSVEDIEDTISTLDYAQRAKKITNKPEVNLKMSKKTLLAEYLVEIDKLRRDLEAARDKKGIYVDAKNYAHMEACLKEQERGLEDNVARIESLQNEVSKWTLLYTEAESNIKNKCEQLEYLQQELIGLKNILAETKSNLECTKTEVERQRYLAEAHKQSGQKLLQEAQSIKQVTDQCVTDNDKLLQKVHRYESLEDLNSHLLNTFWNTHITNIDKIKDLNSILQGTISDNCSVFQATVENNKKQLASKFELAQSVIGKINHTMDGFTTKLLDLFKEDSQFTSVCDEMKQMLDQLKQTLFTDIRNSFDSFLLKDQATMAVLESLMTQTVKNKAQLEELTLNEMSKVNDNSKYAVAILDTIKQDIIERQQEKKLENEKLSNEVARLKSINDTLKKNLDDKISLITNTLNDMKQDLTEKEDQCIEAFDSAQQCMDSVSSHDTNHFTHLTTQTNDLIGLTRKDQEERSAFVSEVDQHSNNECQYIVDKCCEMKKIQTQLKDEYDQFNAQLTSRIADTVAVLDDQIDNKLSGTLIKLTQNRTEHLDQFTKQVAELTASNLSAYNDLVESIAQNEQQTLESYQITKANLSVLVTSQQLEISQSTDHMKNFFLNGLHVYETTGSTPKKCQYFYPQQLTIASPDERIVARFNAKLAQPLLDSSPTSITSELEEQCDSQCVDECKSSDTDCLFGDENSLQPVVEDKTFVVAPNKTKLTKGGGGGAEKATKNNIRKLLKEKN